MAHLVEFGGKQCPMFVIFLAHPRRNQALEYAQTQTSFFVAKKVCNKEWNLFVKHPLVKGFLGK